MTYANQNRLTLFAGILLLAVMPTVLQAQERQTAPRGISEDQLIATLKGDGDWLAKQAACRELRIVGTEKSVPALAALLTDEKLSHMALYAMQEMPYDSVNPSLREAMGKTSGSVKANIIAVLGVRGDEQVINALKDLLEDKDKQVAGAALNALADIGTPASAEAITEHPEYLAEGMRSEVAGAALRVAERLLENKDAEEAANIFNDLQKDQRLQHIQIGAFKGKLAAEPVFAACNISGVITDKDTPSDHPLKLAAVAAIGELTNPKDVIDFAKVEYLSSLPTDLQPLVIDALIKHNNPAIGQHILILAQQTKSNAVRTAAAEALGKIGDKEAIKWMIGQLTNDQLQPNEKLAFEKALVTTKQITATSQIISALKMAEPADRVALITALTKRGDRSAIGALMEQARTKDEQVAVAAIRSLGMLAGPTQLPSLFEMMHSAWVDTIRTTAERAIVMIARNHQAEATCIDQANKLYKTTRSGPQQTSLLNIMGALPTDQSLAVLTAATQSKDSATADIAVRQLVDWPDASALPALADILQNTKNNTHRVLALRAIVRLASQQNTKEQLATLKLAMQHANDTAGRKLVLGGLGKVKSAEAVRIAASYLDDKAVQRDAQVAIDQIINLLPGKKLFNGKSLAGWEGKSEWFRVSQDAVVAGALDKPIPRNEFLCTKKPYSDFELTLQVKLVGENVNAGVQIRSKRMPDHHEMIGYQADLGQKYWGVLYDESRRRKVLAGIPWEQREKIIKPNDWNEYRIRCIGKHIQLWLNGTKTVDYTEPDEGIEQTGLIGLQIHSGPPSQAWYKDITIKDLSE